MLSAAALCHSYTACPRSRLKATSRRIDAMAFQLYRIQNGQLAEHWEVADFAMLMQQLQG